jgi:hypothetical protein
MSELSDAVQMYLDWRLPPQEELPSAAYEARFGARGLEMFELAANVVAEMSSTGPPHGPLQAASEAEADRLSTIYPGLSEDVLARLRWYYCYSWKWLVSFWRLRQPHARVAVIHRR